MTGRPRSDLNEALPLIKGPTVKSGASRTTSAEVIAQIAMQAAVAKVCFDFIGDFSFRGSLT
jgi:alkylhydroperoxidase/carboxymuconolactone decarboxylase family protein YurZ